ncbi:hypothetical protein AHMF7605_22975 [Adhaeribacter arboris]|uniref:Uncharacterized protein n=1 Tax=Adhaeribacter arboris TaxID=2072846 RepID=A0A2T2YKY5_9BACT|nr:hypothetical protein AHMF7605_22975 [Adhaeribacter arboris]
MILNFIILISVSQLLLYLIIDKLNFRYGKVLILTLILVGHFFIFPKYFYPEPNSDGVNCGMPVLGITFAFWVFGSAITLLVHSIYSFIKNRINPLLTTIAKHIQLCLSPVH